MKSIPLGTVFKTKLTMKTRVSLQIITDQIINNKFIVGYMLHKPTIGSVFRLHDKNSDEFIFSTLDPVTEINDAFFKTEKYSYKFYPV